MYCNSSRKKNSKIPLLFPNGEFHTLIKFFLIVDFVALETYLRSARLTIGAMVQNTITIMLEIPNFLKISKNREKVHESFPGPFLEAISIKQTVSKSSQPIGPCIK